MKDDYRNFLFESYVKVVRHYRPKAFVFENVPGILSAKPTGEPITDLIHKAFDDAGYVVVSNFGKALINVADYGVPQNRKRVIILGLNKEYYGDAAKSLVESFYNTILPTYKADKKATVRDAIGDLPALYPLLYDTVIDGKKSSHSFSSEEISNHIPRYHGRRDIEIFHMLEKDIEDGTNQYTSTDALKKLYSEKTGHSSTVHKYCVLRWNEQSNLIPAHLYKDGLRHIHPDSKQARTITVREAARLQSFPDDYVFVGSQMD